MTQILAESITISADVSAGEIVDFEVVVDGKHTGIFTAARVVINADNVVTLSLTDVPPSKLEENKAAAGKLKAWLDAVLSQP